jgi:hypothetical protein
VERKDLEALRNLNSPHLVLNGPLVHPVFTSRKRFGPSASCWRGLRFPLGSSRAQWGGRGVSKDSSSVGSPFSLSPPSLRAANERAPPPAQVGDSHGVLTRAIAHPDKRRHVHRIGRAPAIHKQRDGGCILTPVPRPTFCGPRISGGAPASNRVS